MAKYIYIDILYFQNRNSFLYIINSYKLLIPPVKSLDKRKTVSDTTTLSLHIEIVFKTVQNYGAFAFVWRVW